MPFFPTYRNCHTLDIVQPAERHQILALEQGAMIIHHHILCMFHPTTIFLNRVFTKENTISSLRQSYYPFFLQEFMPLILLKTKDRCKSLTVIRVTKIMCNRNPSGKNFFPSNLSHLERVVIGLTTFFFNPRA
jgi:hypothetical protein